MKRSDGFTLIEVLIALCIIAIALFAILKTINSSNRDLMYLKQKTIANWVAQNVLANAKAGLGPKLAIPGQSSGDSEQLNQHWHWQIDTSLTPKRNIYKLSVTVKQGAVTLSRLTSFMTAKELQHAI